MGRYRNRVIKQQLPNSYWNLMRTRGRNVQIKYYETPMWAELTDAQRAELTNINHIWTVGSRFYKLAQEHYGDASAWWIIAKYNGLPTEGHVRNGAVIYIPFPVGRLLTFWGL